MKKGTSTKPELKEQFKKVETPIEPNQQLHDFVKQNKLDFKVSVFEDNFVYVPDKGFLFFDKPQLIYKATNK